MKTKTYNDVHPPTWPESSLELEASIGRIIIAWGMLERQLDAAIEQVLRVDYDIAWSMSVNLSAQAKLNSLQSLVHCYGDDLWGKGVTAKVDALVNRTSQASNEHRNFLAHGQPMFMEMPDQPWPMWSKMKAGKGGVKGVLRHLKPEAMDIAGTEIRTLVDAWYEMRLVLKDGIEIMDLSENH